MKTSLSVPRGFDFEATVKSHGWYSLPPFSYDVSGLKHVLMIGDRATTLCIAPRKKNALTIEFSSGTKPAIARAVRTILQLDEDLAPFYALTDLHPRLGYARKRGAGRMLRAPSAFENVIKMLLTTNCSWSFTTIMVNRLVDGMGARAADGLRAFPTPEAMAKKNERYYREVIRAGYRAPHLVKLARAVTKGRLDLEALAAEGDAEKLRDDLLELPGIGPYAADNLMRIFGAYQHLGLDSWCRARIKKIYPRVRDVDAFANKNYRAFGRFQGLAMWLDLTREWHEKELSPKEEQLTL